MNTRPACAPGLGIGSTSWSPRPTWRRPRKSLFRCKKKTTTSIGRKSTLASQRTRTTCSMQTADARNAVLDGEHVVRLVSVPTEMEAGIIVGAIEEHEIRAAMAGVTTANFRAEAPGRVDILISEHDLSRATQVLETLHSDQGDVDWSQVDVGEPEDGEASSAELEDADISAEDSWYYRVWIAAIFSMLAAIV